MGGGRGGDDGSGRPSGMSDEQRAHMRQTVSLALDAAAVLMLSTTDSTVTLAPENKSVLVIHTDGRKMKQQVEGGGDVETRGHWQGHDLVVERKVAGGGRVSDQYRVSAEGKQLEVLVIVTGLRGQSVKFRRVYNRVPTP